MVLAVDLLAVSSPSTLQPDLRAPWEKRVRECLELELNVLLVSRRYVLVRPVVESGQMVSVDGRSVGRLSSWEPYGRYHPCYLGFYVAPLVLESELTAHLRACGCTHPWHIAAVRLGPCPRCNWQSCTRLLPCADSWHRTPACVGLEHNCPTCGVS